MTRDDISRWATQCKMPYDYVTGEIVQIEKLEAFAALVAAAAIKDTPDYKMGYADGVAVKDAEYAEKLKWDVHSCGPTCKRYACVAMREAVEAERKECAEHYLGIMRNAVKLEIEACAQICLSVASHLPSSTAGALKCCEAIRSRGESK